MPTVLSAASKRTSRPSSAPTTRRSSGTSPHGSARATMRSTSPPTCSPRPGGVSPGFSGANMAADELKRRSRTVPLQDAATPDASESAPDRIALARALRTLPADHQLVVHLRLVEGLPFAEVARVMNRNVGACQMLMLRAGKSLRAALAAEGVRDV
jgi:hypothetical protein